MSDATSFVSPSKTTLRRLLSPTFWLGGDWKQTIAQSDLPTNAQDVIRAVVAKSRLMRSEKLAVAEELIAHFQDGRQRGVSFESLISKFGDPTDAARLIRRAKLRNRSVWVALAGSLPPVMMLFSLAYLILLWHFHHGQPNPTVDFTAELNHNIVEAKEEDKAWPLYRPLWIKYQFSEGGKGEYRDMLKHMYVEDENNRLAMPSDEQWPQTVAMLEQYQELLDAFRAGAKRKFLGIQLTTNTQDYSDEDFAALFPSADKSTHQNYFNKDDPDELLDQSLIFILLPHVQSMRRAARLFHLDTRLAVVDGDSERVINNIETVLGLSNQVADVPCLVNTLVAIAVSSIGINQLEEVITPDLDFLSEAQLARLQATIENTDIRSWLNYDGEHLFIKDTVQRCYTDDGNGDGRMTAAGIKFLNYTSHLGGIAHPSNEDELLQFANSVIAPASLFTCATRKEALAKAEELFEQVEADRELPFWQSKSSQPDGWKDHEDFLSKNRTKHVLLNALVPAFNQVHNATNRSIARKNGVLTALAFLRYRKKYGKWPESHSDLTPEFLAEFPFDILTGKPLLFKVVDDQLLVYSIGMDYDDDGGMDSFEQETMIERAAIDPGPKRDDIQGDWILWPQIQNLSPTPHGGVLGAP